MTTKKKTKLLPLPFNPKNKPKVGFVSEEEQEYHKSKDYLSASGLKLILDSPAKFKAEFIDGEVAEPTEVMKFGTLVHKAVLEPGEFRKHSLRVPKVDKRTIVGKEAWAEFEKTIKKDSLLVSEKDECKLIGMMSVIPEHKTLSKVLEKSIFEVSGYWFDEEFQIWCRMRIDSISESGWLVDLKTTKDSRQRPFMRSIWDYRYDISAAWYLRGYEAITGMKPKGFAFAAMEKAIPYEMGMWVADQALVEVGTFGGSDSEGYVHGVEKYKKGLETGIWPRRQQVAENISVPGWVL